MANKSNEAKPKTATFVLKPGQEHNGFRGEGENRERHLYRGDDPDNNKVELTENQYNQFKDKFITEQSAEQARKQQDELAELRKKQAELEEALKEKGITVEELLAAHTAKKPNPAPSVGSNEPAPKDATPAPTGSTSDPVNQPPKTGQNK